MDRNKPESSPAKEQPLCISIVICNEVIEDKRTNNKTLVSLFNTITVLQFPAVIRLFIMASLTNGLGRWPITVRILSPSHTEVLRVQGETAFNDPLAVLDMVFEIRGLPLQEGGVHFVDVLAMDTLLAQRRFFVQLAKEKQR